MESRPLNWSSDDLLTHMDWVRALALNLVRDAAEADDLVQETLVAALERRPSSDRPLKPWLRRVVHNQAAFWRRGEARRRAREEERARPEALPSSADLLDVAEAHGRLVRALTKLRDPYRTVLLLRFYEGLQPSEIARRQGLPAATVRSQLKRGLDELRSELDGIHAGDRRIWSLALVPLAAEAPRPSTPTLFPTLRAMNPITQVLLGSSVVVVAGVFVFQPWQPAPAAEASLPTLAAGEAEPVSAAPSAPVAREPVPLAVVQDGQVIHGVVRDRVTGEPLPGYGLKVEKRELASEDNDLLWTDAEGRFESTPRFEPGDAVMITMRDHPGLEMIHRGPAQTFPVTSGIGLGFKFDPERLPLELKATVGPTYTLALSGPLDWTTVALRGSLEVEGDSYGALMRGPLRGGRDGASPWVRFQSTSAYLSENRPWVLSVESEDGLWAGSTTVAAGQGIHADPVPITLAPAARIDVALVSATTLIDPVITIEALADGTRRNLMGTETFGPEQEAAYAFSLGALPAGEYRLLVSTEGFEHHESTLTLVAGESLAREIEVVQGPSVSHVRGELISASGEYDEQITLYLSCAANHHEVMQMPRWEQRDGELVAAFAFDNLPPGDYELALYSFESHFRWDMPAGSLTPPQEGLVLTCRDTDPTRTLEIRVSDAGTGTPIPLASSSMIPAGCAIAQMATGGGGRSLHFDVPLDAELSWWAQAQGYVPAFGDQTAVVEEGDKLVIDVGLDPGWGARIQATNRATGEPLPGVEVLVDDELAGTTDAAGLLDLALPAAPTRIDLGLLGWSLDGGQYDAASGQLDGFGPSFSVLFTED